MSESTFRRRLLWLLAIAAVLAAIAIGGRHLAIGRLHAAVVEALGPNSEVGSIDVGFSAIVINELRIRAGKDWPAADEMRARRIVLRPDWQALSSRQLRITRIEVEDGYLSMLRRKDGKLLLLPSLLAAPRHGGEAMPTVRIGEILLDNAAVDFFDASIRQPAHRLRVEELQASIGPLHLPAMTERTELVLTALIRGPQRDGQVSLKGWARPASKDSETEVRLAGVDLVTFQPYLIKAAETGVRKGALDLDMKPRIVGNHLHAPGKVTLTGLELSTGKTFMGMPREKVVSMMKDKHGRITADFVLDGDIDDPKFSLNERFMTQVATATARFLGISLEGLAAGIGSTGGSVVEGVSSALGKLFGGGKSSKK
jgi:hypothetical protein